MEYSKDLTRSDINDRLAVPENWLDIERQALGAVPENLLDMPRQAFENGGGGLEFPLDVVDCGGIFWGFRCAMRANGSYRPVLQAREWRPFVNYAGLREGDKIILQAEQHGFRETSYKIIAKRRDGDGHWVNIQPPEVPANPTFLFF